MSSPGNIDPRELAARLQGIEAEIGLLKNQLAAVRDEILSLNMAKASINAAQERYEEVLVPGDPKGNVILRTRGLDGGEVLVRASRNVYVPLAPEKALEILDAKVSELEKVASSIEARISQLSREYAVLSKKAEAFIQMTQGR